MPLSKHKSGSVDGFDETARVGAQRQSADVSLFPRRMRRLAGYRDARFATHRSGALSKAA